MTETSVYSKHEEKNKPGFYSIPGANAYIYHFGATLPANKAKMSHFPAIKMKNTNELLPTSPVEYVEIDDDVACAPRKKMKKMVVMAEKYEELAGLVCAQDFTGAEQVAHEWVSNTPKLAVSSSNEDDTSKNIKAQVAEFARNNNIIMSDNKARAEGDPPIILLTKYAKSRPDFMLKLGVVQQRRDRHPDEDEHDREDEYDRSGNIPVSISSEHKKKDILDHIGQMLAGAEKAVGDAIRVHFESGCNHFTKVHAYSLLMNFDQSKANTEKCELFKIEMNFLEHKSDIFQGEEPISICDGLNRVLHLLINQFH